MAGGGEVSILGTLVIVVLKAQNLIDNHKFYKQDPYAVISLASHTQKTPPEPKGGQHPVWDEEMRFPIMASEDTRNRTLKVKVYSKEKKDDLLLGEGEVDISETLRSGEFDDWVPLSIGNTQRGDIYLEMTFFSAGPAPLNRRKSKFTPAQRLSRPAETQQRPPPPHRGSQSSQSASPPAHTQHLAVPNGRSHSGSPAHKDAVLPPLPAQAGSAPPPAVPAILRAGAGAGAVPRPRVQSTAVPMARPMSYAPSERPVSYAGDDLEHELPTPTQYNPNPHPFQQSHQHKPSSGYQSPQASTQPYVSPYPPYHNATTSAPSSPPLPAVPAEQHVSPYPPYHTPSQGPPSPPHGQTHGRTSSFSSLSSQQQQQQQYTPHPPAHAVTAPGGYPPQQSHTPQPPASYPPQSHTPQPPGAYPNTPAHGTSAPPAGFHFPTPTPNYSTPPTNYSSPPPQQAYNAPHGGFYGPPPAGRGYGYNSGQYGQPPRVPSRASSSDLPDPYLEKRYQTPLPLPPGGPSSGTSGHGHSSLPPSAPAPAPFPAAPRVDPGEAAARELQAREEAADRVRREQEQRDAELARRLDQELNIG